MNQVADGFIAGMQGMNANLLGQAMHGQPGQAPGFRQRMQVVENIQRASLVALGQCRIRQGAIRRQDHIRETHALDDVEAIGQQRLRGVWLVALQQCAREHGGIQAGDRPPTTGGSLGIDERRPERGLRPVRIAIPHVADADQRPVQGERQAQRIRTREFGQLRANLSRAFRVAGLYRQHRLHICTGHLEQRLIRNQRQGRSAGEHIRKQPDAVGIGGGPTGHARGDQDGACRRLRVVHRLPRDGECFFVAVAQSHDPGRDQVQFPVAGDDVGRNAIKP